MMPWFQIWATGYKVELFNEIKNQREETRESSISDMKSFRCLGEIQVDMAKRWLAVWIAR